MKTSSKQNEIKNCNSTLHTNKFESDTASVNIHEQSKSCPEQKCKLLKTDLLNHVSDKIAGENSSFHSYAQPYPFTFLTAIKCKLPGDKSYRSAEDKKVCNHSMDPVEPLDLPNLKISSKVCHTSKKSESSQEKSLSGKTIDSRCETKSSTECPTSPISSTTLKSKNFELSKTHDSVLSKDKSLCKNDTRERDNSRDKENRFKKLKKDETSSVKSTQRDAPSIGKCSRNHKYTPRKDFLDKVSNKIIKNDSILNRGIKDNGNTVKKPVKKIREKPLKHAKPSTTRLCRENKSNSSLRGRLVVDKDHLNTNFDVENSKSQGNSDSSNALQGTNNELKNSNSKTTLFEPYNKSNSAESSEILSQEHLDHSAASAMASIEKYQNQALATPLLSLSTPKENIYSSLHIQTNNVEADCSTILSGNGPNQSSNDSIIETRLSQDTLSEKLMDPLRISFRDDSYSNQPEFNNLVTPDVNLTIRSKRRKHFIHSVDGDDNREDLKLSRKNQNSSQGTEIQTGAESNASDQLISTQKPTHSIDGNTQGKAYSSSTWEQMSDIATESKLTNSDNNERQTKISSIKRTVDKSSHRADETVIKTETISCQYTGDSSLVFSKKSLDPRETLHISLDSEGGSEGANKIDDISLSKKMRTMSEISLHETTSSIRTETGTEISISLRDVTCSFNKNLDLEMAQLIDDERQRYNKIEMLFKSREKTLNDRTRKLVKLEEQKKALRDTGQDSRISSVKKKQRALLLKLQQEKDEMNRLKELHKIASQERKLMLQKQRDMFNPDMSTKNILHKLKRSADSQSPRRLSGPMKGYDIRSNSSMSSLIDSDKSQFDRSKFDCAMNMSDSVLHKEHKNNIKLGIDRFPNKTSRSVGGHDRSFSKVESGKFFEEATVSQMKCNLRSKKFDERMPKSDMKYQLYDFESVLGNGAIGLLKDDNHVSLSRSKDQNFIIENVRTKSNAFIEEFTGFWKSHFSQSKNEASGGNEPSNAAEAQCAAALKNLDGALSEKLQSNSNIDGKNTKRKGLKWQKSKTLPANSPNPSDLRYIKKTYCHESKSSETIDETEFRKNYDNTELDELLSNTKQISVQELIKHSDLLKERNEELLKDIVDEREHLAKQSSGILLSSREKERKREEKEEKAEEDEIIEKSDNVSVQSHVSLAISHQSSNDSDKSYLKSVVIRSQKDYQPNSSFQTTKKLEQILKAREATLISRRNCVEEWIAWHARLRDEEERVSRMEKAAYKLVSATARTLSLNDTTVSSENSDVEGRIELLTKKLSDRRFEMTRLKKEARKQAKRRLRALEANLLTQIKRYDATISDMRKKLETKKGPSKDSTKLEIESKSLDDYKVPDIPIKNIQEIYKRRDLLRSQSDSDVSPRSKNNKARDESNSTEPTSSRLESSRAEKIKAISTSAASSTNNSYRSQSDIQKSKISDIDNKCSNVSEQVPSNIGSTQLEKDTNGNSITEIKSTQDSKDGSPSILSKKLSYIELHNKELSDDIHNLENDLKELSEMMLNFSKKSTDPNSMSMDTSRKTSKVVDESCSKDTPKALEKSKPDIESNAIDTELQMRVKETLSNGIPDTDNISTSIDELYSEIKSKDDRVEQHSNALESSSQVVATEESHSASKSPRVVSKKDNKSDTCSIVEIISTTVEKEGGESTIAEVEQAEQTSPQLPSNYSEDHLKIKNDDNISIRSVAATVETQSSPMDNDHDSSIRTISKDDIIQEHKREEVHVSDQSQNISYPSAKESDVLPGASVGDSDNVVTELESSHAEPDEDEKLSKSIEQEIQDVQTAEDYNRNSISDVEDSTIFVPKGESTNLHESFVLKLDNSSDVGMGICSEEFNDILEIIERETKNDDRPESVLENLGAEMAKVDIYTPTVPTDVCSELGSVGESCQSQESKKSIAESEQVLDNANSQDDQTTIQPDEVSEHAESHEKEDDSSEGEQRNNLIEVAENSLDTVQKSVTPRENKIWADKHKTHVTVFLDKTLQVIRDPEYEDISEESLEVSDILNNTNQALHKKPKKFVTVPEKYIIKSESNEVLRILDEISSKSNKHDREQQEIVHDDVKDQSPVNTDLSAACSSNENVSPLPLNESSQLKRDDSPEEISQGILDNLAHEIAASKSSTVDEDPKQTLLVDSEKLTSSDDVKGLEESELHVNASFAEKKDVGLEVDAFDDNLINDNELMIDGKAKDAATEFRTTPMGVSSEKDIEAMIKKLKASLEQPGLEVAELEAKLLEIENLQIELAIKKLEAEEVSYYVREIPNKPPPPYTPPGSGRQAGPNSVSSSVAIIPTNIEELTFITEKATAAIHVKKTTGEDIQVLQAPEEIFEDVKDLSSEAVKKNRQIYNTFLFDLCKELIVDVYKVEEEIPGPSWTKPKVKTKRVMKMPKSVNELNDYVSKEVATLFGFKTKLQRENMVMRWSRKRRDRVDELLAKEAQAEEKEWTKFHHDELAVKNELTVTILNNLLMETTSCVKNAYAKKRKLSVL